MSNYYDREDDRDRQERRYEREYSGGDRGQRYGGAFARDRGWDVGSSGRYGTGSGEDYERGYGSRYYTGDEQGRGFGGGRDLGGRSYRASYDRDWGGDTSSAQREYGRSYGSTGFDDRRGRESERHYEGTNRPPDYGRDFQTNQRRMYRGEDTQGDRDWLDRASDEVSSWFGDDEAERRRRMDKMRDRNFRGRGPKSYRRSDERIREDVNDRLTDHQYLDASDIDVTVKEGEVTLSGKVFDRTDKRLAEDVAESVTGVKNVQNNLRTDKNWDTDTTARSTAARAGNA